MLEVIRKTGLLFFFLAGISAYLISMTSLREAGFGRSFEAIFAISIIGIFSTQLLNSNLKFNSSLIPLIYLIIIITPITILQLFNQFPGIRLSSLFAYYLAFFTGYIFGSANNDQLKYTAYGLSVVGLFIGVLMLTNGVDFNLFGRADFFSNNPNQLALYSLAGMVILSIFLENKIILAFASVPILIYGAISISDAYFVAVFLGFISYIFFKFFFNIRSAIFFLPFLLIVLIYIFIFFNFYVQEASFIGQILELWSEADQGNLRTLLYKHGLLAALNSPIVGLGAGVFSGISGPLQEFESHNTFIDLMTNGGIILSIIFYLPFLNAIFSFAKNSPLKSAVITSFVIFTLFHFIARHPIVWIAWGCCIAYQKYKE